MSSKHYIVSSYIPDHESLRINMYKVVRLGAESYAKTLGRKLAEGPTQYFPDNFYGPVELWPLAIEEGEENPLSR